MTYQVAFEHDDLELCVHDHQSPFRNTRSFTICADGKAGDVSIRLTRAELNQLRDTIDMILRPYDQPEPDNG